VARRKITQDFYDKLLDAYRELPAHYTNAAKAAGTTRKTSRKAWHEGWPDKGFPPIEQALKHEEELARAQLARAREAELTEAHETNREVRQAAAVDAAATREREVMMVRAARENVVGFLKATNDLLHGGVILSGMIRETLDDMRANGKRPPLKTSVYLMNAMGGALRQGNEAATLALRMERLLAGEPEAILGVQDMTVKECVREVRQAQRAMERAAKRGLVSLPGGKADAA